MSMAKSRPQLGKIGIWSLELRYWDRSEADAAAAELDDLGFGALWIPGGIDGAVLEDVDRLLAVTKRSTIATGILNIWKHQSRDVAGWFSKLPHHVQDRVLLGLGISHGPIIGEAWKRPLEVTRQFVVGLAAAGMPASNMCLAALGPRMLELAREQTAGAHPYLVTPEHTATARRILGAGKLLAPEQGVILEQDASRAHELAAQVITHYGQLPNYRNNWLRLGFTENDIDSISDRLVDGLFAWGGMDRIAARIDAHLAAGADHVCLQVISGGEQGDFGPLRAAWRALAAALL